MSDHTHRWANAAQTIILRSDGACIPADPANTDYQAAIAAGIEPFVVSMEDLRAGLLASVEAKARALRVAVAGTDDATKLAVYREKYAVAIRALANDSAALAMLADEAEARGETSVQLATLVKSLGDQWTAAGLAIDAAYQDHKAAILIADTPTLEGYDYSSGWPF